MSALADPALNVIASHVPCVGCGYDLYASQRDGRCPECGKAVQLSASAANLFASVGSAVELRRMGVCLLVSSIFAGLCPAACLLAVQSEHVGAAVAMSVVFAVCAGFAGVGEAIRRKAFTPSTQGAGVGAPIAADVSAAGGLLLVNLAAYVYAVARLSNGSRTNNLDVVCQVLVGVGFFLLFATAWRALPTWRAHAQIAGLLTGAKLSKFLTFMAWTKALYETAWLFCCWMPFGLIALSDRYGDPAIGLAIGALFGLIGFAVVWLLMIIAHAILLVQIRRATAMAISCANP